MQVQGSCVGKPVQLQQRRPGDGGTPRPAAAGAGAADGHARRPVLLRSGTKLRPLPAELPAVSGPASHSRHVFRPAPAGSLTCELQLSHVACSLAYHSRGQAEAEGETLPLQGGAHGGNAGGQPVCRTGPDIPGDHTISDCVPRRNASLSQKRCFIQEVFLSVNIVTDCVLMCCHAVPHTAGAGQPVVTSQPGAEAAAKQGVKSPELAWCALASHATSCSASSTAGAVTVDS